MDLFKLIKSKKIPVFSVWSEEHAYGPCRMMYKAGVGKLLLWRSDSKYLGFRATRSLLQLLRSAPAGREQPQTMCKWIWLCVSKMHYLWTLPCESHIIVMSWNILLDFPPTTYTRKNHSWLLDCTKQATEQKLATGHGLPCLRAAFLEISLAWYGTSRGF